MSNRRRLRRAGERLIVKAFGRCKEGSVNIISAPTGTGKTYNIQHSLIPSEIEAGKTHFLYLTVYTDSVAQEYYDFTKSLNSCKKSSFNFIAILSFPSKFFTVSSTLFTSLSSNSRSGINFSTI